MLGQVRRVVIKMKKIIIYPIMVLLVASLVLANVVERAFQKTEINVNDELKVTLTPPSGTTAWAFTIPMPEGWAVKSKTLPKNRYLNFYAMDDTPKTFVLIPSKEGNYDFTGSYWTSENKDNIDFPIETITVGSGGGCSPSWVYGDWGDCIGNKQYRTGNDGCGNSKTEERICETPDKCAWYQKKGDEGCEFNKLYIGIAVAIGIFILLR